MEASNLCYFYRNGAQRVFEGNMPKGIIAVVDDDETVRHSTFQTLQRSGISARMFENGDDFLRWDGAETISCILLDLYMPGSGGMAVLAALRERSDSPPVIVITGHGDLAAAIEAMKLGACDFIGKPYRAEELLTAIGSAVQASRGTRDANVSREWAMAQVDTLTFRQRQVLLGIVHGLQNKIIAFELELSIRTVETYRAQLLEKLNVRGTAEAVRLALDAGLAEKSFRPKSSARPWRPAVAFDRVDRK
jgi:two-component system, LuxR family, response regulator FixJ